MKNSSIVFVALSLASFSFLACNATNNSSAESNGKTAEVISEKVKITLTPDQRNIKLEGGFNTRDLGGIVTTDGRTIKKGLLYRGGDLNGLTPNDISVFEKLGIHTVVDFRSPTEIKLKPNKSIPSVKTDINLPIMDGDVGKALDNFENIDMAQFLVDGNKNFVKNEQYRENYRKFFELVQNPQQTPILYHCTYGKDRTGFATAMILFSLGVDEKTVFEDYLSSNEYLEAVNAEILKEHPEVKDAVTVRLDYLKAALDVIKEDYGSVDKFLKDMLKVDVDKMKSIYLN